MLLLAFKLFRSGRCCATSFAVDSATIVADITQLTAALYGASRFHPLYRTRLTSSTVQIDTLKEHGGESSLFLMPFFFHHFSNHFRFFEHLYTIPPISIINFLSNNQLTIKFFYAYNPFRGFGL
jgi:hypothetical protein